MSARIEIDNKQFNQIKTNTFPLISGIQEYYRGRSITAEGSVVVTNSSVTNITNPNTSSGIQVPITIGTNGFMVHVTGIILSCTRKVMCRYGISNISTGFPTGNQQIIIDAYMPIFVPINEILRGSVANISIGIVKWFDSDTTDATFAATIIGKVYPDETRSNAATNNMMIGDSINDTVSASATRYKYMYLFANELRKRAVSIALTYNKAVSGKSTTDFIPPMQDGSYIISDSNLITLAIGTNDALLLSRSKAEYKANMNTLVDLALSNVEANSTVLMLAPPPVEADAGESLLIQYRAAVAEIYYERSVSAAYGYGRVFFVDLATAGTIDGAGNFTPGAYVYDRKLLSNYMASDATGNHIHPSDIGNASIFNNAIIPFLNGTQGTNFLTKLKSYQ